MKLPLGFLAALQLTLLTPADPLSAQPPLPLADGSVLAVSAFTEDDVLVELSDAGEVLGQLELVDPMDLLGAPSGLTRLNGELWVSGGTSVHRLDPITGELSSGFSVTDGPTLTALCTDGEFLLVGEFVVDAFQRYDIAGNLIDTIDLDTQLFMVGADSDGERIYVGSHSTGDVHVFDMSGTTVGIIETDLPSDLTGVSLGDGGETLWVVTGLGINEVHQFDLEGKLLRTFDGQFDGLMGLYALRGGIFADGFESGDTSAWH